MTLWASSLKKGQRPGPHQTETRQNTSRDSREQDRQVRAVCSVARKGALPQKAEAVPADRKGEEFLDRTRFGVDFLKPATPRIRIYIDYESATAIDLELFPSAGAGFVINIDT